MGHACGIYWLFLRLKHGTKLILNYEMRLFDLDKNITSNMWWMDDSPKCVCVCVCLLTYLYSYWRALLTDLLQWDTLSWIKPNKNKTWKTKRNSNKLNQLLQIISKKNLYIFVKRNTGIKILYKCFIQTVFR